MSAGRHSFRQTEVRRLFKAALEAGLKVKGVTTKDGRPYLEIDHGDAAAAIDDKNNPWDKAPTPEQP